MILRDDNNGWPEMQLADDRARGVIQDNLRAIPEREAALAEAARDWGEQGSGVVGTAEVIRKLVQKGGGLWCGAKSSIHHNQEISDIVDNIVLNPITPFDWDEPVVSQEQIQVDFHDLGSDVEIVVKLFHES